MYTYPAVYSKLTWYISVCKQKTAYEVRISDCSSDVCSSYLLLDRLGHRRSAGYREVKPAARRKGTEPRQPALRPRPPDQPHLGPGEHQIWAEGPEPRRRHRLLDGRAFDR